MRTRRRRVSRQRRSMQPTTYHRHARYHQARTKLILPEIPAFAPYVPRSLGRCARAIPSRVARRAVVSCSLTSGGGIGHGRGCALLARRENGRPGGEGASCESAYYMLSISTKNLKIRSSLIAKRIRGHSSILVVSKRDAIQKANSHAIRAGRWTLL
ncbi:hypothetical protein B0H11DRAFT_1320664 [Mycena galericulata]|nr:hypothetical protein B0H11DRAFT_1320664 [Mycena galericulata]